MTEKLVALRSRMIARAAARSDEGQGSLEYVGVLLVAALIVVAIVGAVQDADVAGRVGQAITDILSGGNG